MSHACANASMYSACIMNSNYTHAQYKKVNAHSRWGSLALACTRRAPCEASSKESDRLKRSRSRLIVQPVWTYPATREMRIISNSHGKAESLTTQARPFFFGSESSCHGRVSAGPIRQVEAAMFWKASARHLTRNRPMATHHSLPRPHRGGRGGHCWVTSSSICTGTETRNAEEMETETRIKGHIQEASQSVQELWQTGPRG